MTGGHVVCFQPIFVIAWVTLWHDLPKLYLRGSSQEEACNRYTAVSYYDILHSLYLVASAAVRSSFIAPTLIAA
jgi:hypothetical protein